MNDYRCKKCLYTFCSENEIPYCPACDCESLEEIEEDTFPIIEDTIIEEHHIHPKFMDNESGKGEKYRITKKQHSIVHGKIIKWIWKCINKEDREKTIQYIISESKKYLGVDNGKEN